MVTRHSCQKLKGDKMEIVKHEIGKEADVIVEIVGGKIVVKAQLDSSGVGAGVSVTLETDYFLDKLSAAIPGQIDDAVIGIFKAALKAI